MAIYRFIVSCTDQRDGLYLHSLHGGMFGDFSDVGFKWNYEALRKSSDNLQQHLFLSQQRIIGHMMWMWRGILELCNIKDYQYFGKFNSLRNTLTNGRSNMSLSSCLFFTLMKQHSDMYTYKVETQQRRRCTFDIAIHNR